MHNIFCGTHKCVEHLPHECVQFKNLFFFNVIYNNNKIYNNILFIWYYLYVIIVINSGM